MANIKDLCSWFSLTEEEEHRVDVPQKKEVTIVRLAAKFFTKRVVNAEVVNQTFKPLWKLIGEMKIRDIDSNILLFEFDNVMDLEQMLEFEPWTYDKSIVVFRRAVDVKSTPLLPFNSITFWVQLHNVPDQCLTQAIGEAVGNTIGSIVHVVDPEDDGEGVEVVSRSSRGAPLWKKGLAMERKLSTTKDLSSQGANVSNSGKGGVKDNLRTEANSMEAEPSGVVFSSLDNSHSNESSDIVENSVDLVNSKGLHDDLGNWIENEEQMGRLASSYFSTMFTTSNLDGFDEILNGLLPTVIDEMNTSLNRP
nr:hypothetical protein CFP56_23654 [Quercus suber]